VFRIAAALARVEKSPVRVRHTRFLPPASDATTMVIMADLPRARHPGRDTLKRLVLAVLLLAVVRVGNRLAVLLRGVLGVVVGVVLAVLLVVQVVGLLLGLVVELLAVQVVVVALFRVLVELGGGEAGQQFLAELVVLGDPPSLAKRRWLRVLTGHGGGAELGVGAMFPILDRRRHAHAGSLSGGEQAAAAKVM
jgi:hypothetical protein